MREKKRMSGEPEHRVEMLDNILNGLCAAIYVTDMETNRILYANASLLRAHEDQPLVGDVCWEALKGGTKRCISCPIPYLLKHPGTSYEREEYNGRHLKIFDSIIPWSGGKLAHLQYTVDITR